MKQWSLDARSEGQPWPFPLAGVWSREGNGAWWSSVLAQRAVSEDPRTG